MQRIKALGHLLNKFTEGNPGAGIIATRVSADYMNIVQEEICNVIEFAGLTIDQTHDYADGTPNDKAQLRKAIMALITAPRLTETLAGTAAGPGLQIGSHPSGFFSSYDNTAKTSLGLALDGIELGAWLWERFPGTNNVSTTGTLTTGSDTITALATTDGIEPGMLVQPRSGISGTLADTNTWNIVGEVDHVGGTVVMRGQGTNELATANVPGGSLVFYDPGKPIMVVGTQTSPMGISSGGYAVLVNTSDWAAPMDCTFGVGSSFGDSLAFAADNAWDSGFGAAMSMHARSHLQAGWSFFYNEARFANLDTTGNTTKGSRVITGIPSTANIQRGALVIGGNFGTRRTTVTAINSGTQVTVDHPATAAGTAAAVKFYNPSFVIDNGGGVVMGPKGVSGNIHTIYGQLNVAQDGLRTKLSTANVSSPPTNAELVSAFGPAASVGAGFVGVLNDNGGSTAEWIIWSDGTYYFYAAGTKAV